jgi:hypothetical protein
MTKQTVHFRLETEVTEFQRTFITLALRGLVRDIGGRLEIETPDQPGEVETPSEPVSNAATAGLTGEEFKQTMMRCRIIRQARSRGETLSDEEIERRVDEALAYKPKPAGDADDSQPAEQASTEYISHPTEIRCNANLTLDESLRLRSEIERSLRGKSGQIELRHSSDLRASPPAPGRASAAVAKELEKQS